MTKTLALSKLIDALTLAKGPMRELDCLIQEFLDPRYQPEQRGSYYGEFTGQYFWPNNEVVTVPKFTESLDVTARLSKTLLPDYWWLARSHEGGREGDNPDMHGFANVGPTALVRKRENASHPTYAATPPIALLISIFKALMEASDD